MPKINIMYELDPIESVEENQECKIKIPYEKGRNVKVSDKVFELMKDEGLLRKTDDGYVFVGKYEDLHDNRKKKTHS
jgi:hypothetical protein